MYKFVRTFKKPQKVIDNAPKSSIEDNAILEVTPTNQTNLISKTSSSFNANKPLISNDVIENANNTETVRAELSSESKFFLIKIVFFKVFIKKVFELSRCEQNL